jgi:hypothetical protein
MILVNRHFRPQLLEWLSLLLPAAIYYGLQFLVAQRQGFNMVNAVVPLTLWMAFVVIVAGIVGKPRLLVFGALIGCPIAVVLWQAIPKEGPGRMF